jgi:serine protease inhibitor
MSGVKHFNPMATALAFKVNGHFWRLFLCGILFEILLAAAWPVLPQIGTYFPHFSWLFPLIQALILIIHIPVLFIVSSMDWNFDDLVISAVNVFVLLACLLLMAAGWTMVFNWTLRFKNWLFARVSMRQKQIVKWVVVSALIVFLGQTTISVLLSAPRAFTPSADATAMVSANNTFAIDLYQRLKTQPGNLFFSPYSISSALAMTYAGARGQTESEMAKVLHFDPGQTNVHSGFRALTDRINDLQRWNRIKLVTANSLWCQKDYRFTDTFLNLVKQDYHADAKSVDFVKASSAAQNEINSWAEQNTDGKIQDLIGDGQITPLTRLVLCNAIYFKGKWQTQFKTSDTRPAPFYISSNETMTVPTMSLKARFKTARSDDGSLKLLEMPYVGDDLSMIILLPASNPGWGDNDQPTLSDIEEKLTPENLRAWLTNLDQAGNFETMVSIPRFTTTQSFNLSDQLKSMGMPSAFDMDKADFSGMDETRELSISAVLHKAFVEVNEEGTEAAAATMVIVKTRGMPEQFIANHPFIFLIRDNGSGAILFLGRIVDPTK